MFKNISNKTFKVANKQQRKQLRLQQQQQQQQQATTTNQTQLAVSSKQISDLQPLTKQDYFTQDSLRTYSCIHCRAHLASHDDLISKLFQGNHGRAYLFNKVVNVGCKKAVQRELLTGLHAVADIYCDNCETTLGWKYEQAFVPSQKYKEGKYIIELVHMFKENQWDLTSYNAKELLHCGGAGTSALVN